MQKMLFILLCSIGMIACSSAEVNKTDSSNLIGAWNWISSCGGFTGGCWYPSADNYESIEFKSDFIYIKKANGNVVSELIYAIGDTIANGSDVLYTIEFENGSKSMFRFINDTLSIEGGDFWKNYKRMK